MARLPKLHPSFTDPEESQRLLGKDPSKRLGSQRKPIDDKRSQAFREMMTAQEGSSAEEAGRKQAELRVLRFERLEELSEQEMEELAKKAGGRDTKGLGPYLRGSFRQQREEAQKTLRTSQDKASKSTRPSSGKVRSSSPRTQADARVAFFNSKTNILKEIDNKAYQSAAHAEVEDLGDGRFHAEVNGPKLPIQTLEVNIAIQEGKIAMMQARDAYEATLPGLSKEKFIDNQANRKRGIKKAMEKIERDRQQQAVLREEEGQNLFLHLDFTGDDEASIRLLERRDHRPFIPFAEAVPVVEGADDLKVVPNEIPRALSAVAAPLTPPSMGFRLQTGLQSLRERAERRLRRQNGGAAEEEAAEQP